MYKAINTTNNTEIIILDQKSKQEIENLRILGHENSLVCQGCKQPVRVRAGEERRPHFAHKHLQNCPYRDGSKALLDARAVLYEWLAKKFSEGLTIEKKSTTGRLFRPVDCWVEHNSKRFAYWLFDRTLIPPKREVLLKEFTEMRAYVNWIFISQMLRTDLEDPNEVILSTTERAFAVPSDYDGPFGKTLHYLDVNANQIITMRELRLIHKPQVYRGLRFKSRLDEVLVSPKTGEFVHQGEYQRLKKYREKQAILEKRRRVKEVHAKRQRECTGTRLDSHSQHVMSSHGFLVELSDKYGRSYPTERLYSDKKTTALDQSSTILKREGICIFCGKTTTDWWSYEGKSGRCKCRACYKEGKS